MLSVVDLNRYSSKYVIKTKEYISNIYVVEKNSGDITGINTRIDRALLNYINNNPDNTDLKIDEKLTADYEFIQWEKDNNTMLIHFEINGLDKNIDVG